MKYYIDSNSVETYFRFEVTKDGIHLNGTREYRDSANVNHSITGNDGFTDSVELKIRDTCIPNMLCIAATRVHHNFEDIYIKFTKGNCPVPIENQTYYGLICIAEHLPLVVISYKEISQVSIRNIIDEMNTSNVIYCSLEWGMGVISKIGNSDIETGIEFFRYTDEKEEDETTEEYPENKVEKFHRGEVAKKILNGTRIGYYNNINMVRTWVEDETQQGDCCLTYYGTYLLFEYVLSKAFTDDPEDENVIVKYNIAEGICLKSVNPDRKHYTFVTLIKKYANRILRTGMNYEIITDKAEGIITIPYEYIDPNIPSKFSNIIKPVAISKAAWYRIKEDVLTIFLDEHTILNITKMQDGNMTEFSSIILSTALNGRLVKHIFEYNLDGDNVCSRWTIQFINIYPNDDSHLEEFDIKNTYSNYDNGKVSVVTEATFKNYDEDGDLTLKSFCDDRPILENREVKGDDCIYDKRDMFHIPVIN